MAIDDDNSRILLKAYSRIDELLSLASKDPIQIQKILPSALQELKTSFEEQSSRLEQVHGLLNGIIENTTDLIAAIDTNFRYLAINEAYHRECQAIYGVDIRVGDSMIEMLVPHPEDQKNALEVFSPAFRGESVVTTQIYGDPGKSRRIYELHISPIHDSHGHIIGAAHINTDITERKRAEEALRESELRLEKLVTDRTRELEEANRQKIDILESISDSFYALDKDLRFVYVNKAAEKIWGLSRADLIGRKIEDVFTELVDISLSKFNQVLKERRPQYYEVYSKVIQRWGEMNVYPTQDGVSIFFHDITDRKRAEEKLRESEERFREMAETINSAFWISKFDGNRLLQYKYMSPAFERIFGIPVERVYEDSRAWLKIIHPEDSERFFAAQKKRAAGEYVDAPDFRIVRSDGTIRWIKTSLYPVRGDDGKILRYVGIADDITERKRAEQALRESEEKYSSLFYSTPAAMSLTLVSEPYADVNDAFSNLFGYAREDLIGKTSIGLGIYPYPAQRHEIARIIQESGSIRDYEVQLRRKDGTLFTALFSGDRVKLHGDNYILGTTIDITGRKQMEEALRESEERFRTLNETAPVGVAVSLDGTFAYTNPAYERMLGYGAGELVGRKASDFYFDPHDRSKWFSVMKEKRAVYDFETRWKKKDGTPVLVSLNVSPIIYGNKQGVISTAQDITERKRAEEERQQILKEAAEAVEMERRRLFDILENLPVMIVLLTPDYHIVFANRSHREKFGEAGGRPCYRHCFGISEPCEFCEAFKVLETGRPHQWECTGPDGSAIEAYNYPFTDVDGSPMVLEMDIDVTERKRAEEALRESQEQYRGVVENTTAIILRSDPRGVITFANHRALEFFGYAADELIGRHAIGTIVPPQETTGRDLAAMVNEIAHNPERFHSNANENICKDGRRVWMEWTNSGIYDGDGKLKEFLSVGIDATDRKRTEEALRESKERLTADLRDMQILRDLSMRPIAEGNENMLYQNVLDAAIAIVNADAGSVQILDKDTHELVLAATTGSTPELDEHFCRVNTSSVTTCETALISGKQAIIDFDDPSLPDPDGSLRLHIENGLLPTQSTPLITRSGERIGILSMHWRTHHLPDERELNFIDMLGRQAADMFKQKQVEEALAAERQRLFDILESLPVMICLISPDHDIVFANRAFREKFGELDGRHCYEFCCGYTKSCSFCEAFTPFKTGQMHHWEFIHPKSNVIFDVYNLPFSNMDGSPLILEMDIDITERKQMEESLITYAEKLKAAYKEMESFSYSVSHDLRVPLRAIDGYTRMILKKQGDKIDDFTKEKFKKIRNNTALMGRLIDSLLELSRLERKTLSLTRIGMNALAKEVWDNLKIINPERILSFTADKMPMCHGDKDLIRQVLANLLSNAVKFTENRGMALIEAGGHIEGKENIYYIKDNGAGFDMAYSEKLFGVFSRLHHSSEFEGIGIGLASVKRIIHKHGGRVWAEGKVDEGATFYFSLPSIASS